MLSFDVYLQFLLVACVYIGSPGPSVMFFIANAMRHGAKPMLASLAGNTVGLGMHAALALIGIEMLAAGNAALFRWLSALGALYLFYLAFGKITDAKAAVTRLPAGGARAGRPRLADGFLLAASNPKPLVFFGAVLPSLLGENAAAAHRALFSAIFLTLSFAILFAYARLSAAAAGGFHHAAFFMLLNYAAAAVFILFGVSMLANAAFPF
ncbi:MAG: LysE family translocator [Gammaproteobacteria bacterium]